MAHAPAQAENRDGHHANREPVRNKFVRYGDLDLDQGYEHQDRIWTIQRIVWGVIALLVILAFAGLFGGGPISKATASRDGEPLRVAYERFGHRQSQFHPVRLDLTLDEAAFQEGEARVYVDRTYLAALQVQSISPLPDRQEPGLDRTVYVFTGDGPSEVTLTLQATKMGRQQAEIGLMNGDQPRQPVTFSQFIYP
jgi:hypothetical protein